MGEDETLMTHDSDPREGGGSVMTHDPRHAFYEAQCSQILPNAALAS